MKQVGLIVFFIAIVCTVGINAEEELTEIVQTDKGIVRGLLLKTVQNSVPYSAFKGIPYGKPPIGRLRFKPPVEADSWDYTLDATAEANSCPQVDVKSGLPVGNEDCLYLNVYTPKTKFNSTDDESLAVMVWIYGGGFYEGKIHSSVFGPDFLIEDNVILVAMNYRLGPLGFLTLNHPEVTGNAGLKDQVLALKWVQKNIKYFGGDPSRVTIFGQSAGGDSVELHKVSDVSKGLFSKSIAMSGAALNSWGLTPISGALSNAFTLVGKLNLSSTDVNDLVEQLYNVTTEDLLAAAFDMITTVDMPFVPTIEDKNIAGNTAFLSECVIHRYKSGNFQDLPHMLGFVVAETAYLPPESLYAVLNSGALPTEMKLIWETPESAVLQQIVDVSSDLWFVAGIDRTQQYLSKGNAPVYYYRNSFDYDNALHKLEGSPINGTAHSDDLAHIFWKPNRNQSLDPESDIAIQRKRLVRLWTNFAKFGDPTPVGSEDTILNAKWTASGSKGDHLEISNDGLKMGPRPADIFVKVLKGFMAPAEAILNGCQ